MGLFKESKPVLKVIAVTHETRNVRVEDVRNYGYGGNGETTTKTTPIKITLVLGSRDGELFTKEFNGNWTMNDIKKWEEL